MKQKNEAQPSACCLAIVQKRNIVLLILVSVVLMFLYEVHLSDFSQTEHVKYLANILRHKLSNQHENTTRHAPLHNRFTDKIKDVAVKNENGSKDAPKDSKWNQTIIQLHKRMPSKTYSTTTAQNPQNSKKNINGNSVETLPSKAYYDPGEIDLQQTLKGISSKLSTSTLEATQSTSAKNPPDPKKKPQEKFQTTKPQKADNVQNQRQKAQRKSSELTTRKSETLQAASMVTKTKAESKPAETVYVKVDEDKKGGNNNTKYLVYLCEGRRWCGGWGDRQKGLTSLYLLALLTNRQFKIVMSTPCDVKAFYAPAKVKWIPYKGELESTSKITLDGFHDPRFFTAIGKTNFNSVFDQKVVYVKTNRDFYYNMRHNGHFMRTLMKWNLGDRMKRFRWAWKDLMQPTVRLLTHVEEQVGPQLLIRKGLTTKPFQNFQNRNFSNDIGNSTLICAHVRLGKTPTIPNDGGKVKFNREDISSLFEFMASQDRGNSRFFVATDSDELRQRALTYFGDKAVAYGGHIMHIDRQRGAKDPCGGFEQALAEQLILSLCDILVASDSGFSRYASYVSNRASIYRMKNGKAMMTMKT